MAQEAGMRFQGGFVRIVECVTENELRHFAKMVASAEREECVKMCDSYTTQDNLESCNDRTVIRHETAEWQLPFEQEHKNVV